MGYDARLLAVVDDDADVHAIEDHEPDCLVLDLHMPELSGFDVQGALAVGHPLRCE
jgi:CheY-like chemotaxis protein